MQPIPATAEQQAAIRRTMRNVRMSVARFSRNDAEDIVQEAMTRAVHRGIECDAEPWLRLVARRIATDRSRRAREFASDPTDLERASGTYASSPEDIVVANDSVGVIRRALNALPTRYRDALVTYAEGQDHTEVAERFDISPNATWSLLCRARARLRQELNRVGYAAASVGFRIQQSLGDLAAVGAVTCVAMSAAVVGPVAASTAEKHLPVVAEPKVTVSDRAALRAAHARSGAPRADMRMTEAEKVAKTVLEHTTVAQDEVQDAHRKADLVLSDRMSRPSKTDVGSSSVGPSGCSLHRSGRWKTLTC
jgi:RNA polymerase sigma factor (sigma-70 family)